MVVHHRHFSSSATVKPGHYRDYYTPHYSSSETLMARKNTKVKSAGPRTPLKRPHTTTPGGHSLGVNPERAAFSSTPRANDWGGSHKHNTSEAVASNDKKNTEIFEQWKQTHTAYDYPERGTKGVIKGFLRRFVPSSVTPICNDSLKKELVDIAKAVHRGRPEKASYSTLMLLLQKCVEGLPANKKINFVNTSSYTLEGITEYDHLTGPDILAPYPGQPVPKEYIFDPRSSTKTPDEYTFDPFCHALEVKPHTDPIDQKVSLVKATEHNLTAITQIVKSARNLLYCSSACYVYVIGIYTPTMQMRIYRFDHSGSISCGFNYVDNPEYLYEFMHRFLNPLHGIPNTMVGWDETIRIPTEEEIEHMQKVIQPLYSWLPIKKRDCRWLRVRVDEAALSSGMNISSPIVDPLAKSGNSQLSPPPSTPSRRVPSTDENWSLADLAISDVEAAKLPAPSTNWPEWDPFASPLSTVSSSQEAQDSQETRETQDTQNTQDVPESDQMPYLEGITFGEPLYKSTGLVSRATYVTRILVFIPGHGYYVFVVKDAWRQLLRDPESLYYELIKERYPKLKELQGFDWVKKMYPEINDKPNWIPGLAEYYGYLDLSSSELKLSTANLDDRGHKTIARRFLDGKESNSDRVRVRALTGPVGGYIADFARTRDFATVIRDAVVGHYIALACGVLHRDISDGNILVAKEPSGEVRGFLHDFDYATRFECTFDTEAEKKEIQQRSFELKVLTGTRQFMAIGVLKKEPHMPHHDIESFYWVMVWILLQHAHNHQDDDECGVLFDHASDKDAIAHKHTLVTDTDKEPLVIKNNDALNMLLTRLREIIAQTHRALKDKKAHYFATHEQFARGLQAIIKEEDWPVADRRIKYNGPSQLDFTFKKKEDSQHGETAAPDTQSEHNAAPVEETVELVEETVESSTSESDSSQDDDDISEESSDELSTWHPPATTPAMIGAQTSSAEVSSLPDPTIGMKRRSSCDDDFGIDGHINKRTRSSG